MKRMEAHTFRHQGVFTFYSIMNIIYKCEIVVRVMSIFKGAGVAIVTPMKEDGSVNYEKLGELIEFQIENHTDCIIICGTTGESSTLSHDGQIHSLLPNFRGLN